MAEILPFFPSPLVPASSLPARHRNFHWTFPLASARSPRGLAIVRFDRGFLTNQVLGDLAGRPITVRIAETCVQYPVVDQRFIVFATACVHGKEIAVTEIGVLPDTKENEVEVARIVASLPQSHLSDRLAAAVIVVHRTVRKIERATEIPRFRARSLLDASGDQGDRSTQRRWSHSRHRQTWNCCVALPWFRRYRVPQRTKEAQMIVVQTRKTTTRKLAVTREAWSLLAAAEIRPPLSDVPLPAGKARASDSESQEEQGCTSLKA